MSAKTKADSKSTALVPAEKRAIMALGLQHREKEFISLAAATAHIVTITNDDGYKQVDTARKTLKRERLGVQKIGDEKIDDAKRVVKLADAELTRLVGILESEEDRLMALQDARDNEIETQRQAEIDAEIARQAALQERIAELQGNRTLLATSGSALIAEHIADLVAIAVDGTFEECREQAEAAKAEGLEWLRALWTTAVAHETEQRQIAEDRAELARLKAENARLAAEKKADQDKVDADIKRQTTEARGLRDAHDPAITAGETVVFESGERLQPFGNLASYTGLSAIPTPAPDHAPTATTSIPSRGQIVAALCAHFVLDEAQILTVLARIDWREALAEAA